VSIPIKPVLGAQWIWRLVDCLLCATNWECPLPKSRGFGDQSFVQGTSPLSTSLPSFPARHSSHHTSSSDIFSCMSTEFSPLFYPNAWPVQLWHLGRRAESFLRGFDLFRAQRYTSCLLFTSSFIAFCFDCNGN